MKIIIVEDVNSDMLSIETSDNVHLFYGNYWDFNRDGKSFQDMFEKLGFEVEYNEKDYDEWE